VGRLKDRATARLRAHPWLFAALLSLLLLAVNLVTQPDFGKPSNWPSELASLSPLMILAVASSPSIISGGGGLDLSIGPLAVLCNVVLVNSLLAHGLNNAWLDLVILMGIGTAVGAINGLLVAVARYRPVIATLCTLFVVSGLIDKVGGTEITAGHNWTGSLGDMVGPIPGALLLMAPPLVIWIALGRTAYHRTLYCVGGDDATAFSAGVGVVAARIVAYALGGLFAAFAGIALTAVVQSSQASVAPQYVLLGLTAVALGGTPLLGGRGGMLGSAFGATALYLMQTLLPAIGVSPNWLSIVYGAMLIGGVLLGARLTSMSPSTQGVVT
jgi:ribose transport system permease protein